MHSGRWGGPEVRHRKTMVEDLKTHGPRKLQKGAPTNGRTETRRTKPKEEDVLGRLDKETWNSPSIKPL